jgi:hypothetical protein
MSRAWAVYRCETTSMDDASASRAFQLLPTLRCMRSRPRWWTDQNSAHMRLATRFLALVSFQIGRVLFAGAAGRPEGLPQTVAEIVED